MESSQPRAFIFDLDGTVYLGEELIPGARETLQWVRKIGAKIRFVTNNPRYSQTFYAEKLTRLGIPAQIEEVVTSAKLTADYLKKEKEEFGSLYVIGEQQLRKELLSADLNLRDEADADTVVVSFDTTLTYEKLMTGYHALKNGARFIATNPDAVCPSPDGGLVDAGAIIAALEVSTGRKLELVIGKPSKILADMLAEQLETSPVNCMIVGDRLNTDIRLGKRGGMRTAWINPSGNVDVIPEELRPDYILTSIKELPSICP